jgi:TonB-linked SusC/RagA family outer membrane protein
MYGSSEPLYIIDGMIIDNSSNNLANIQLSPDQRFQTGNNRLADINPHDVERIEVINGPAAAAIYGSRAANGVVQIFTKKGKNQKPEVTLFSSVNFNQLSNRVEFNEYPFRFGYQFTPNLTSPFERRTMVTTFRPDTLARPPGGPRAIVGRLDTAKYPVTRYDYQDDIFQPAWGTDQHLSIRGGNQELGYFVSASYLNNGGIVRNTGFERYGLQAKVDAQLNKWARLGTGLILSNSQSREMPNSFLQYSPLGAMNHIDNVYNITALDSVEFSWINPMSSIETFEITIDTRRTIGNINLLLTPLKGLTIKGLVGLDTYSQQGFTYQGRMPYVTNLGLFSDGYVSATKLNYSQWSTDLSATYKRDIGRRISSITTAGYAGQYISNIFQAQEGRNLVPFVRTLSAASTFHTVPVDTRSEQTIYGWFIQETLGYNDLLFLTLAGRSDASSAFGSNAGDIFYPKAGLSFSLSETSFWKDLKLSSWFNTIHLRAAYGQAGNLTGIGPYDRFTSYSPTNYYTTGYAWQNRRGNQEIKPEIKTEMELGTDLQFFNGRIFARFNLYKQEIKDLVIPYNWAPSTGNAIILDNLGKMENKGFELMLGGRPVEMKKFQWDISLLYNQNRNQVTELYANAPFIGLDAFNTQGVLVGYPMNTYYGTYLAREENGDLLLSNNLGYLLPQLERGDPVTETPQRVNKQPSGSPVRKVLGDPNPDYTATLINHFRFGQLGLRIQLDRVAGFEVFNWTNIIRNNIGNGKTAEKELRGELPRGWTGALGGQISGPYIAEVAVEDGTYTSLRELTFSYTLKDPKWVKNMELLLSARNLFIFTDYSGFDPQTSTSGQSIVRSIDYSSTPLPRVIQFSIITTFK